MKKNVFLVLFAGLLSVTALAGEFHIAKTGWDDGSGTRTARVAQSGQRPTIVLFISDDHGYADSGAYGDEVVKTPHLDRLAQEGMKFINAFAASPLCSPSRCVIETGLMPFRNGAHKFGTPIRSDIKTMPEYFRELGYFTAEIGKFHHAPRSRFPYDLIDPDENKAAAFIRAYKGDKPLFLVVCTHPPHTPWVENEIYDPNEITLPPTFVDTPQTRADRAKYYSDVTLMDSILGKVANALEDRNQMETTLFVYTSDQGANWPFGKWNVYDAGLRVPFIVRWPGVVEPGSVTEALVSLADLLPTCMEAAGGKPDPNIDGKSFLDVIKGTTDRHREVVYGAHTGNDNGGANAANHSPARMIRTRRFQYILNLEPDTVFKTHITGSPRESVHYLPFWKTWETAARTDEHAKRIVYNYRHRPLEELYDLDQDPHETNNLINNPEYKDVLRSLKKQLAQWRESQGDTIPINANYAYQVD
jgi:N-sulfoglucosamine sulfohydrolase